MPSSSLHRIKKETKSLATVRVWTPIKRGYLLPLNFRQKNVEGKSLHLKMLFPTLQLPHLMARGVNSSHFLESIVKNPTKNFDCVNLQPYDRNIDFSLLPFTLLYSTPHQLLADSQDKAITSKAESSQPNFS